MLTLRGILQPLTERRILSDPDALSAGIREVAARGSDDLDPLLGVAANVLTPRD